MVEDLLGDLCAAVDGVHDLERSGLVADALAEAVRQPVHESGRLVGEAEPEQGVEGEGGVADPGVAVVPVAAAADLLGQARRRRGDHRAGRLIREQLEHESRAVHGLAPAPSVARLREPAPPELDRLLEVPQRLLGREGVRHVALGHRLQHERLALAGLKRELAEDALLADAEADPRGEREIQRGCLEDDAMLVDDGLVRLASVVETRVDLDAEGHLAPDAEDAAGQPLPRPHRHEVLELAYSDRSEEAGDEDVRVREVELLDGADPDRR